MGTVSIPTVVVQTRTGTVAVGAALAVGKGPETVTATQSTAAIITRRMRPFLSVSADPSAGGSLMGQLGRINLVHVEQSDERVPWSSGGCAPLYMG